MAGAPEAFELGELLLPQPALLWGQQILLVRARLDGTSFALVCSHAQFVLLASIWFVTRRYRYVRRGSQFTADLPRPEGY